METDLGASDVLTRAKLVLPHMLKQLLSSAQFCGRVNYALSLPTTPIGRLAFILIASQLAKPHKDYGRLLFTKHSIKRLALWSTGLNVDITFDVIGIIYPHTMAILGMKPQMLLHGLPCPNGCR